jgi:hypothetical protein
VWAYGTGQEGILSITGLCESCEDVSQAYIFTRRCSPVPI